MAGELVARHIVDQQWDGAHLVTQPERAVCGELAAADHLLEAEHRAGGDAGEQRLAAAGAAEQHRVDRVHPGIDANRHRGLAQMWRRRSGIEPDQEGPVHVDRADAVAEERSEAGEVIHQDAGVARNVGGRHGVVWTQPGQPSRRTRPVAKSISARGMRSSAASPTGRARKLRITRSAAAALTTVRPLRSFGSARSFSSAPSAAALRSASAANPGGDGLGG